jgi:hypothetical protein
MLGKSIGITTLVGAIAFLNGGLMTPAPALAQRPTVAPNSEVFWIKLQFRGGMRATPIVPELMIRPDGMYRYKDGIRPQKSGLLSKQELRLLRQRMGQANFQAMKSKPFQGTCPIAYDGIEVVYTFQLKEGVQEIPSCKYAIDGKSKLFQQLARLSRELGG